MPTSPDPKARARAAFDDLPTTEKTAFVIEATFSTIGAALRETGQHLADAIHEFDPEDFFRTAPEPEAPAPTSRKKAASKTARAKKPAATKTTASRKKTTVTPPKTVKPKAAKPKTTKTAGRKKKDDS